MIKCASQRCEESVATTVAANRCGGKRNLGCGKYFCDRHLFFDPRTLRTPTSQMAAYELDFLCQQCYERVRNDAS